MQAAKLSPLMSGGFLGRLELDRTLMSKPRPNANGVIENLAVFSPLLDLTAFAEESGIPSVANEVSCMRSGSGRKGLERCDFVRATF